MARLIVPYLRALGEYTITYVTMRAHPRGIASLILLLLPSPVGNFNWSSSSFQTNQGKYLFSFAVVAIIGREFQRAAPGRLAGIANRVMARPSHLLGPVPLKDL